MFYPFYILVIFILHRVKVNDWVFRLKSDSTCDLVSASFMNVFHMDLDMELSIIKK